MPIIPRTKKVVERKVEKKKKDTIKDSEDPFFKRRMMDSPNPSQKQTEQVYDLRETVYDDTSKISRESEKQIPKSTPHIIQKEVHNNVFKTREKKETDRFDHTIEFGKLDKLKSERDLDAQKLKFISLKDNVTQHEKSYKVIQNKNSKNVFFL